jgi:hypothetical protein
MDASPGAALVSCKKCHDDQPQTEFYASAGRVCKTCHRARGKVAARASYARNPALAYQRTKAKYKAADAFIRQHKIDNPTCADCKQDHPYWRLDFDHRSDKTANLSSDRVRYWGMVRIAAEIAKCDLVCANCHRDRTFKHLRTAVDSNDRLRGV